jgi:hypothetical protein
MYIFEDILQNVQLTDYRIICVNFLPVWDFNIW